MMCCAVLFCLVSGSLVERIRKGQLIITYFSVLDANKQCDQLNYVLYTCEL